MKPTVWEIVFLLSLIHISIYGAGWSIIFFQIVVVIWIVANMFGLPGSLENLGVEVAKLRAMQTVLRRFDPLLRSPQCFQWLISVEALQRKEQDIKVGYGRCGLNYLKRLHLIKEANQMLYVATDLLVQGGEFLHPRSHLQGAMSFYMKKVIDFINVMDKDSGLLGIWGTGGVGKSCLLKLVNDSRSEYDNDSLNVMFVHAGIRSTVSQVQEAIATIMGLSITHNETSQANIIRDHLTGMSFLLLLDDLWEYLDLEAVGIPLPLGSVAVSLQGGLARQKQRKVVLATRNMNLCDEMGCDNTIEMECIDEEDAWKLYRGDSSLVIERDFAMKGIRLSPELLPKQESSSCKHPQGDRFPGIAGSYNKVCYFIEDKNAHSLLLGVWGMRGMGKTTLLKLMRDAYTGKACFDYIMFVGAGTGSVVNNVQHAIAINLGLDLAMMSSLDELSRAKHIFDCLEHKSFLLLLDDIREPLINWWDVGVPIFSHRQQKIIFATRSQAACALMGCRSVNIIAMQCLGKDDAWSLFRDKAGIGTIGDHPEVHHLAKKMVAQCGGLPLALCTLGRAMSNKRDPREWRSACSQLTAIGLEPCEIDEKVGTIIVDPLWKKRPILWMKREPHPPSRTHKSHRK